MGAEFWIKRFLTVLVGAFIIIAGAQLLKGREVASSIMHGATWGFFSAVLFTGTRYWRSGRGQHCAICKDTPKMRDATLNSQKAEQAVHTDRA